MPDDWRYIFGPVRSRRLGYSLGIDPVPSKTCNLNCVYCELGRTTFQTMKRRQYVAPGAILREVRRFLEGKPDLDAITFSGSGEPTLNTALGRMIRGVKRMTSIPVVVLTNGTLLYLPAVRRDLLDADVVAPSLDAVSEAAFRRVDRPHGKLRIDRIVDGLVAFRSEFHGQLWLEILLVRGLNDSPLELERLRTAIHRIQPDRVHLNTVVRPPAEPWARPLTAAAMRRAGQHLDQNAALLPGMFSQTATEAARAEAAARLPRQVADQRKHREME